MFNVLLYTWVWLTVLLLWAIVYYVVHRFSQMRNKEEKDSITNQLPIAPEVIEQAMNEEISEIVDEDDEVVDTREEAQRSADESDLIVEIGEERPELDMKNSDSE